jgi:hypothetical protein
LRSAESRCETVAARPINPLTVFADNGVAAGSDIGAGRFARNVDIDDHGVNGLHKGKKSWHKDSNGKWEQDNVQPGQKQEPPPLDGIPDHLETPPAAGGTVVI